MLKARWTSLAYRHVGGQRVALLNVTARKCPSFSVGSGSARARASALLFASQATKRTSYFVFLVYSRKDANWYAEIECSVATEHYDKYKKLFEREIARSIKIDAEKTK